MELLQLREKEIFSTLKELDDCEFVVIGGYAVNSYSLIPRFSVDCDIVVRNRKDATEITKRLIELGYFKDDKTSENNYRDFERFIKILKNDFKVSFDILIGAVVDRNTEVSFSAEWVFENSRLRNLKGKTLVTSVKLRILILMIYL